MLFRSEACQDPAPVIVRSPLREGSVLKSKKKLPACAAPTHTTPAVTMPCIILRMADSFPTLSFVWLIGCLNCGGWQSHNRLATHQDLCETGEYSHSSLTSDRSFTKLTTKQRRCPAISIFFSRPGRGRIRGLLPNSGLPWAGTPHLCGRGRVLCSTAA